LLETTPQQEDYFMSKQSTDYRYVTVTPAQYNAVVNMALARYQLPSDSQLLGADQPGLVKKILADYSSSYQEARKAEGQPVAKDGDLEVCYWTLESMLRNASHDLLVGSGCEGDEYNHLYAIQCKEGMRVINDVFDQLKDLEQIGKGKSALGQKELGGPSKILIPKHRQAYRRKMAAAVSKEVGELERWQEEIEARLTALEKKVYH